MDERNSGMVLIQLICHNNFAFIFRSLSTGHAEGVRFQLPEFIFAAKKKHEKSHLKHVDES